jgi:hypothetical protein
MKHSKSKKSGGGGKKHTKAPTRVSNHWHDTTEDDVAAVWAREGKERRIKLVRRTKLPNGSYKPLKHDSNSTLSTTTAALKPSTNSHLAGEGTLGEGKEFKIHRGNCKFDMTLMAKNMNDGVDRARLLEQQKACIERYAALSRKLMTDVFKLATPEWKGPRDAALAAARTKLFYELKDKHKLKKESDMLKLYQDNDKVKKRVDAEACKIFVDKAYLLPGVPRTDDDGNEREPTLRTQRKVWKFKNYDPSRDSKSQAEGPAVETVPSDLDHWLQIEAAMTNPTGQMRREFNPLDYADGKTGAEIPRPLVPVKGERFDVEGNSVVVEKRIPDPFFNPVFEGRGNRKYESLVATSLIWHLFRGPTDSNEKYGIHLIISAPISIMARVRRTREVVTIDEDYVTGFTMDDDELSDEEADNGAEEGEASDMDQDADNKADDDDDDKSEDKEDDKSEDKAGDDDADGSLSRGRKRDRDDDDDDDGGDADQQEDEAASPSKRARKEQETVISDDEDEESDVDL